MPLDPHPPNVVSKARSKESLSQSMRKKEQIMILGCANAIGQSIPP